MGGVEVDSTQVLSAAANHCSSLLWSAPCIKTLSVVQSPRFASGDIGSCERRRRSKHSVSLCQTFTSNPVRGVFAFLHSSPRSRTMCEL